MIKAIRLNQSDNVATLLADAAENDLVEVISDQNQPITSVKLLQKIPFGNKVAIAPFAVDDQLIKDGCAVGKAIKPIPVGQLVHVQNIRSLNLDIPEHVIAEIIQQMGIREDS